VSKAFLAISLLTTAGIAASCGTVDPGFSPPVLRGQYEMVAASTVSPGSLVLVEVNFTQTGASVVANKSNVVLIQADQPPSLPMVLSRFGGVCDNEIPGNDFLQGAFSSATQLSLGVTEAGALGNGILTGNATVSADGSQITNGTYASPAQCGYVADNGNLTGVKIKSFSGRYAGRISNPSGTDLVIVTMNQTGFNLTVSGTDNGTAFTLTGTVVGATFDVAGSIAGRSVRYVGLYNHVTDEFRVFDPSLAFLGVLQGGT